jgi:gas vesicle protein
MEVTNDDGTVSFQDVTQYSNRENSFFGAKEANRMNEAMNAIMSMLENGTDLYTDFQNYFKEQQAAFAEKVSQTTEDYDTYISSLKEDGDQTLETIKTDYRTEMNQFESQQQQLFTTWFEFVKGQMGDDVAGNLQNQIDSLDTTVDGFVSKNTEFSQDGSTITEEYGNKKVVTEFVSDKQIVQKLYEGGNLSLTKTITFSDDGLIIKEEVV